MTLPFSRSDFLAAFSAYNGAIWPLQLLFFAAGLLAVGLLFYRPPWAGLVEAAEDLASPW